MARNSPNPGQKILYFLLISISTSLLYVDIKTDKFDGIKNNYESVKISLKYLLKSITVDPVISSIDLLNFKNDLITENKKLKKELDQSRVENYLILNKKNIFKTKDGLDFFLKNNNLNNNFEIAKLKEVNPNVFKCCDKHRMFIEIFSDEKEIFSESFVFNNSGIIGQVVNGKKIHEVILLTDISHSTPVKTKSNNFFCNAQGSGRSDYIVCNYNPLVWDEKMFIGKIFYTSGLGGIYPSGVKIGILDKINKDNLNNIKLEIKLIANPISDNLLGVINL